MINQTSILSFDPSALSFPLSQTGQFIIFDDFASVAQNTAITTTTSLVSETKWTAAQIGAATGILRNSVVGQLDGTHFGILELTNSTATTALGVYIAKGGGGNTSGVLNPSSTLFDVQIAFKLAATATNAIYFGFVGTTAQATIPVTNATTFVGMRYDTSLSDTAFMVGAQAASAGSLVTSGVLADTSWHKFRMRSAVAGTVLFSVDNSAEVSVSTNISNSVLDICFQQINRTAASATAYIDYIALQVSNLTR